VLGLRQLLASSFLLQRVPMGKSKAKHKDGAGFLPMRGSFPQGTDAETLNRDPDQTARNRRALLAEMLSGMPHLPVVEDKIGPLSDITKYPAMRMLLTHADEDNANKETRQLIKQTLDREQHDRLNCLAHAEWKGRVNSTVTMEHLQGRSNNMCYHFMFELDHQQPTERVDGFLALYRNSEQQMSDVVALLPLPKGSVQTVIVLVRLVYLTGYIREVIQTEPSIGLLDKAAYGEKIDDAHDRTVDYISRAAQKDAKKMPMIDIALEVSALMHRMVESVRGKFPALAVSGAALAKDVPLMRHLELFAQIVEKKKAGLVIPSHAELLERRKEASASRDLGQ